MDNFWKTLGEATSLTYRPDLVFEHHTPHRQQGRRDESYIQNNSDETTQHDSEAYNRYMAELWPTERLKLA